jgi:hypothetical protein
MAMEEGNQWWKRRAKHGRGMLFSSPDLMWSAACEYFDDADGSDYWKKREVAYDKNSASFISAEFTLKAPFTWEGLCLYLGCNLSYFRQFRSQLKKKKQEGVNDEMDDNFSTVIECIEAVITRQQIEGAAVGAFNQNIIARYLGLKDNTEHSTPNDDSGKQFKVTLKLD